MTIRIYPNSLSLSTATFSLALVILLALGLTVAGIALSLSTTAAVPEETVQTTSESELVSLTNESRLSNHLSALRWNENLYAAAQAKAADILAEQYFDHISPSGTTPWSFIRSAGYSYQRAGENLAVGFSQNTRIVTAWLESPTHRANLLDASFTEIAIAEAHGTLDGESVTVVVQMFGQPTTFSTALSDTVLGLGSE